MSDPTILFVKPGTVRPWDKRKLSKAGVTVVEVDHPSDIKLVRAGAVIKELSYGAILGAAAKAISSTHYGDARTSFGIALTEAIKAAHPDKLP